MSKNGLAKPPSKSTIKKQAETLMSGLQKYFDSDKTMKPPKMSYEEAENVITAISTLELVIEDLK